MPYIAIDGVIERWGMIMNAEDRKAIYRLIKKHPMLSDRQIANMANYRLEDVREIHKEIWQRV